MGINPGITTVGEPWHNRLRRAAGDRWRTHRSWLVNDVLVPLLVTRAVLVLLGLLSAHFPTNPDYPIADAAARGWQFTPIRLIDMWGRWDTGWYFDLINHGYYTTGDFRTVTTNLAFFPLYPFLVKALTVLSPIQSDGVTLLAGVAVSNAFLLGALVLLHRLALRITGDRGTARRTVWYLLLYPAGFFLSAMYTEAIFLFFSLAAFYAAERKAWGWASAAGVALTLARPLGVLVAVPLGLLYLRDKGWDPRRLRPDVLWFGLMPLCLVAFGYYQYTLTGDPLATLHSRAAWARHATLPWEVVLHPQPFFGYITGVEQALTMIFVIGSLAALWWPRRWEYGLWALLLVGPPLFSGLFLSFARYFLVAFPVFVVAARLGRRPAVDMALMVTSAMVQALYFFAWCQFFWVA